MEKKQQLKKAFWIISILLTCSIIEFINIIDYQVYFIFHFHLLILPAILLIVYIQLIRGKVAWKSFLLTPILFNLLKVEYFLNNIFYHFDFNTFTIFVVNFILLIYFWKFLFDEDEDLKFLNQKSFNKKWILFLPLVFYIIYFGFDIYNSLMNYRYLSFYLRFLPKFMVYCFTIYVVYKLRFASRFNLFLILFYLSLNLLHFIINYITYNLFSQSNSIFRIHFGFLDVYTLVYLFLTLLAFLIYFLILKKQEISFKNIFSSETFKSLEDEIENDYL